MEAVLNIYENCESDKATRTYTCRRLLYGVAKKLEEISKKSQNASEQEQENYTVEFIQTIFKDFKEGDLEFIDPSEYMEFVKTISLESQNILNKAAKN